MRYNPSVHAVERIREYFGIMEEHAKNFVNQLMESAKYVTTEQSGRLVYKHEGKDVMIVVDSTGKHIITVLPPTGKGKSNVAIPKIKLGDSEIFEKARAIIKRELTKAQRNFTTEYRRLSLAHAELSVEIAQANVKRVRCKAPHTQSILQRKIDDMQTQLLEINAQMDAEKAKFERMKSDALAFVEA